MLSEVLTVINNCGSCSLGMCFCRGGVAHAETLGRGRKSVRCLCCWSVKAQESLLAVVRSFPRNGGIPISSRRMGCCAQHTQCKDRSGNSSGFARDWRFCFARECTATGEWGSEDDKLIIVSVLECSYLAENLHFIIQVLWKHQKLDVGVRFVFLRRLYCMKLPQKVHCHNVKFIFK